jgi:3-dehydro-L-gulonate 2-dehydrogenase
VPLRGEQEGGPPEERGGGALLTIIGKVDEIRVSFEKMYGEFLRVLLKAGFSEERAKLCARLFAESSLDGVYSHGLNRFPRFIEYIKRGYIDIHATPERAENLGALERWDGKLGPGNLNAHFCMARAIEIAHKRGIGCIGLRNSNHWMRGGTYGWQAAEANCIAVCFTNTEPNLPPWGGIECRIGNNPLVIAVPRKDGHVVLDMAMSQFSYGKLEAYEVRREVLPVYGGFDRKGDLTHDPDEIAKSGRPLPIGYWKGSGLSVMLDLLATLLSGGRSTHLLGQLEAEYGVSQTFICFDIGDLYGSGLIDQIVNEIIDFVHGTTPAEESGAVYYPGERTLLTRKTNMEGGIPVDEKMWQRVLAM